MTGTDKSGFNPAGGDRPSYMPGGDYFEPKALSDALPQVMNTVLKVVHTSLPEKRHSLRMVTSTAGRIWK